MSKTEPTLLYIAGPGRSGSTMLDLMLGQSSEVASVGEVHRLNRYARNSTETCMCGQPVLSCEFWTDVESYVKGITENDLDRRPLVDREMMIKKQDCNYLCDYLERLIILIGNQRLFRFWYQYLAPRNHKLALQNSFEWYRAVRKKTGHRMVVDSTKDARRLGLLYHYSQMIGTRMKVIFLVRDGRGVASSAIKREGVKMRTAAEHWKREVRKTRLTVRPIDPNDLYFLRYEDLCREPEVVLRKICLFLGIPFEPIMLVLDKNHSHNIGGNPMRFRKDETSISLDEKWKSSLTPEELDTFRKVCRSEARKVGYEI